jgi:hypothetical protein
MSVFGSIKLRLNNKNQLTVAADQIAKLGYQFAANNDGSTWGVLDSFIPKSDRWK